jgi:hypothetical protein
VTYYLKMLLIKMKVHNGFSFICETNEILVVLHLNDFFYEVMRIINKKIIKNTYRIISKIKNIILLFRFFNIHYINILM